MADQATRFKLSSLQQQCVPAGRLSDRAAMGGKKTLKTLNDIIDMKMALIMQSKTALKIFRDEYVLRKCIIRVQTKIMWKVWVAFGHILFLH